MTREPNQPNPPSLPPAVAPTDAAETLQLLGKVARSSVVDAVAERLRGEILAGRLPAGSRLPSERELSFSLGVNRLTLRAALARLEALGLIATRHGAGTEVTSWRERAGLDSLAALIGTTHPSDPAWYELAVSLLELRRILATEAVALAAERHTPEQLVVITRLAEEQQGRIHDALEYARGEIAFERAIIRATGNVAFELVLNMFARFPEDRPEVVEALYDEREHAALFYGTVIELIRGRDAAKARDAMGKAFALIDADWMARHAPRAPKAPPAPPPPPATKAKTKTKTKIPTKTLTKNKKRRIER